MRKRAEVTGMRALIVLALAALIAAACGGASSPPIQASPAVTSAPRAPGASPASTGGYDYGY